MVRLVELPVLVVDGSGISSFDDFVGAFSALLEDFEWHGSLDAFNDILRGGCGTPHGGFVLQWNDSARSREQLGWPATVRWLEDRLERCHPTNREKLRTQLYAASRGHGTTLFDWLVEIVRVHGPGGDEEDDNVFLNLA